MKRLNFFFISILFLGSVFSKAQINPSKNILLNDRINKSSSDAHCDSIKGFTFDQNGDSVLWSKKYFYNDANGYDTLILSYYRNESNANLYKSSEEHYVYDKKGLVIRSQSVYFDENSTVWEKRYLEKTFDENKNEILSISVISSRQYGRTGEKTERQYNLDNKLIFQDTYELDVYDSVWTKNQKIEHFYNLQDNDTLIVHYQWDNFYSKWDTIEKQIIFYDGKNDTLKLLWKRDNVNTLWELTAKSTNTYDEHGRNLMFKRYSLNEFSVWKITHMQEIVWLEDTHLETIYSAVVNDTFTSKTEAIYDTKGKIYMCAGYNLDPSNNWKIRFKAEMIYNENGQITELNESDWYPNFFDLPSVSKKVYKYNLHGDQDLEIVYKWNSEEERMEVTYKSYYYYFPSGQNSVSYYDISEVCFYPNPAKDILFIDFTENNGTASLFNMSGLFIKSYKLQNGKNILFINDLENGFYLIKVSSGNSVTTKKIYVE